MAEAAADVLTRFAPAGVAIESLATESAFSIQPDDAEGRPIGPLAVRAYLPANDRLEETRRRLEEALWHLGHIRTLPQPEYRAVAEADWAEAWKAHYRPIRVGRRLVILPAWREASPAPDAVPICLEPGMAFGTGTHPTTQLCLAALEDYLQPGDHALDLGTGSGILAIAAAKLGAASVLALDTDPQAVRAARQNVRVNGVEQAVRVERGSLASAMGAYHLTVANILASVIVEMLGQGLAETLSPGGILIVSGLLEGQAPQVAEALQSAGLRRAGRRQMDDWVALLARRAEIENRAAPSGRGGGQQKKE